MRYVLIFVLLFSLPVSAEITPIEEKLPVILTPWNSPEIWKDTWQVQVMGRLSRLGGFVGKELGGWLGKNVKKNQREHQKRIDESIKERMDPITKLWVYEKYPHKLKEYHKLEEEVKSPEDLGKIIDHLEEVKKKYGGRLNKKFDEYKDYLEQVKGYWEEHPEQYSTILASILVILVQLAVIL